MAGTLTRGEVYLVQLSPAIGTELNSPHPCVVVQSNLLEHPLRPRTIVVPITSREPKKTLPFIVEIRPPEGGLIRISYALCDQVTRIDKTRIIKSCGILSNPLMAKIDSALRLALEL